MKKVIMFILALQFFHYYAEGSYYGKYKWREAVLIQPSTFLGIDKTVTVSGTVVIISPLASKPGQSFRVVGITDDNTKAIIQILDYTEVNNSVNRNKLGRLIHDGKYLPADDFFRYNFTGSYADYLLLSVDNRDSRNYGGFQAYFAVPLSTIGDDELVLKESKIGCALSAGVINFPFKIRPQKDYTDFSGSYNFGAGLGIKLPHKSWRQFNYSVISGYSISNIVLDSSNTRENQGKLASTNNFSAFSFSLGFLIEYQKVQAGIFIGWDMLNRLNQREFRWVHQGKTWISIGFGFSIFSVQKEIASSGDAQD